MIRERVRSVIRLTFLLRRHRHSLFMEVGMKRRIGSTQAKAEVKAIALPTESTSAAEWAFRLGVAAVVWAASVAAIQLLST